MSYKIIEAYRVLNSLDPPLPFYKGISHYGEFWYDIKTHPITQQEVWDLWNDPPEPREIVILTGIRKTHMTPSEEIVNEIMNIVEDNIIERTKLEKKAAIESAIQNHVRRFNKLQKNVVETSLPHELAARLQHLYDDFAMGWEPLILFKL